MQPLEEARGRAEVEVEGLDEALPLTLLLNEVPVGLPANKALLEIDHEEYRGNKYLAVAVNVSGVASYRGNNGHIKESAHLSNFSLIILPARRNCELGGTYLPIGR